MGEEVGVGKVPPSAGVVCHGVLFARKVLDLRVETVHPLNVCCFLKEVRTAMYR